MTFAEWWESDEANDFAENSDQESLAWAAWHAGKAAERKRCAKIAENQAWSHAHLGMGAEQNSVAIAAAIRKDDGDA